jgi:hypothetical protein
MINEIKMFTEKSNTKMFYDKSNTNIQCYQYHCWILQDNQLYY